MIRNKSLSILIGLTVLMLLSSCKVREPIQTFLDIPISKNINPSKTTVSENHNPCYSYGDVIASFDNTQKKENDFQIGSGEVTSANSNYKGHKFWPFTSSVVSKHSATVPLYILYRKLKTEIA